MDKVNCVIAFVLCGILAAVCLGQENAKTNSSVWSPLDKQFSIDTPVVLKATNGYGEADDPGAVLTYAGNTGGLVFMVVVLKYRDFQTETTDEKFGGLFFLIGGDDDWDFTTAQAVADGFPAQEIAYKNQAKRGLFIDAGERVFVLGVFAKKKEELDRALVTRFFRSFRVNHSAR